MKTSRSVRSSPPARRLVIVGAGPAGLARGFWRARADPSLEVRVLEANARSGGQVWSPVHEGYLCEWGPQAIRPSAGFDALVSALEIEATVVPASETASLRWVGKRGRLHRAPDGPKSLLSTPLLPWAARWRLALELLKPRGRVLGETVGQFVARRFGRGAVPMAQAMVRGIYAGDVQKLEVASAFPLLAELEREHGSVVRGMMQRSRARGARGGPALATFGGGMQELIERMRAKLDVDTAARVVGCARRSDGWHLTLADGSDVQADEVVLAGPAWAMARILRDYDAELADELAGIEFVPIVHVHIGVRRDPEVEEQRGFGFLLDPGEQTAVLGAIYVSELFPQHAPSPDHALFRVMLGGAERPDAIDRSEDEIVTAAYAALRRYAKVEAGIDFVHVAKLPRAIPQYVRGHTARLARIEARLATLGADGLELCGNSYRGVALGDQLGPDAACLRAANARRGGPSGAAAIMSSTPSSDSTTTSASTR